MSKKQSRKKFVKHHHGTPNPIFNEEEKSMMAVVDKALSSTSNSQVIGRNGELPLLSFLNRYLPYTLKAVTGHFVPPSGELSPQIDVMILDARYPLLAENLDGSVLAMLHSVIFTIEVKTNLTTGDIKKMWKDCVQIIKLASEVKGYGSTNWGAIGTLGFAYKSKTRLETLENNYVKFYDPRAMTLDLSLLRLSEKDQEVYGSVGAFFHTEPPFEEAGETEWHPGVGLHYTPLSDLYYNLVQHAYYTLATRNYGFQDLGQQIMNYFAWSTKLDW